MSDIDVQKFLTGKQGIISADGWSRLFFEITKDGFVNPEVELNPLMNDSRFDAKLAQEFIDIVFLSGAAFQGCEEFYKKFKMDQNLCQIIHRFQDSSDRLEFLGRKSPETLDRMLEQRQKRDEAAPPLTSSDRFQRFGTWYGYLELPPPFRKGERFKGEFFIQKVYNEDGTVDPDHLYFVEKRRVYSADWYMTKVPSNVYESFVRGGGDGVTATIRITKVYYGSSSNGSYRYDGNLEAIDIPETKTPTQETIEKNFLDPFPLIGTVHSFERGAVKSKDSALRDRLIIFTDDGRTFELRMAAGAYEECVDIENQEGTFPQEGDRIRIRVHSSYYYDPQEKRYKIESYYPEGNPYLLRSGPARLERFNNLRRSLDGEIQELDRAVRSGEFKSARAKFSALVKKELTDSEYKRVQQIITSLPEKERPVARWNHRESAPGRRYSNFFLKNGLNIDGMTKRELRILVSRVVSGDIILRGYIEETVESKALYHLLDIAGFSRSEKETIYHLAVNTRLKRFETPAGDGISTVFAYDDYIKGALKRLAATPTATSVAKLVKVAAAASTPKDVRSVAAESLRTAFALRKSSSYPAGIEQVIEDNRGGIKSLIKALKLDEKRTNWSYTIGHLTTVLVELSSPKLDALLGEGFHDNVIQWARKRSDGNPKLKRALDDIEASGYRIVDDEWGIPHPTGQRIDMFMPRMVEATTDKGARVIVINMKAIKEASIRAGREAELTLEEVLVHEAHHAASSIEISPFDNDYRQEFENIVANPALPEQPGERFILTLAEEELTARLKGELYLADMEGLVSGSEYTGQKILEMASSEIDGVIERVYRRTAAGILAQQGTAISARLKTHDNLSRIAKAAARALAEKPYNLVLPTY